MKNPIQLIPPQQMLNILKNGELKGHKVLSIEWLLETYQKQMAEWTYQNVDDFIKALKRSRVTIHFDNLVSKMEPLSKSAEAQNDKQGRLDYFFAMHWKSIAQYKRISKAEERFLFWTLLNDKDEENKKLAKEKIFLSNIKLVIAEVKKYTHTPGDQRDLLQQGCVSLMSNIDRFDPLTGNAFSTMITWWIRQGVEKAKLNESTIPLSTTLNWQIERYRYFQEANGWMEQTNPTKYKQMLSQLMIDIKIGYSKLLEIKKIVKNGKNLVISQTELTNKDADGQDVTDNLSYQSTDESNESDNPATHMMKEEYKKLDSKLKADLKKILTELEWKILDLSFGFDQEAKTNIDISRNLEIPSKDVKKIKNTALQKITDNQDKLQYYIEAMQQRDENN